MKRIVKHICIAVFTMLIFFHTGYSQSPNYKFQHIGKEQGIIPNEIICIEQDHQGFMWFGTEDGLYMFDGFGTKVYKHDMLDSTSLGNNNVFAILEDKNDILWIATAGGGLNRFDRKKEQFKRYVNDPNDPNSLSANVVSALYEDSEGDLWVGTWNGLNLLKPDSGKITRFIYDANDPNSMNPRWIRSVFGDRTGAIWVGTDGGISRFDRQKGEFTHFGIDPNHPDNLNFNPIYSILEDQSGTVWFGSRRGLESYDQQNQQFTNSLTGSTVTSICEDHTGLLWIGTDKCLTQFDRATHDYKQFFHDAANNFSLSHNLIRTIYEDRDGVLWVGTQNGVNRLDRKQYPFKHIIYDPDDPNSLIFKRVNAMCEGPKGDLWIVNSNGTSYAINKLNQMTGLVTNLIRDLELNYIQINNICQDHSGILWIATGAGLERYDPQKGQITRFTHDPNNPNSISSNYIWRIYEDQSGIIWLATRNDGPSGIDRFDPVKQQFTHIDFVSALPDGASQSNSVHSISEGKSGRLWFGTTGDGIFLLNPGSDEFVQFNNQPGNSNSLSNEWIGAVHEDRKGMVWAAPWYGGLNRLDPESGKVTTYTEKDGLASNYITSIVEDEHGRLWLTTKNGLSRFDPRQETFKNFDRTDGLLHTSYEQWNASIKSKSGELFFGGGNGVDYVHPDSIRDNPQLSPVVFTNFTRYKAGNENSEAIIEPGITEKKHINLSYRDHILTFEFAALNYRNPQKNQYKYKLEGFNDVWIDLGNKHDVTFTNLKPGNYTLMVKGSNNDGIWNEEPATLTLSISPPWWKTGFAFVGYFLLLGSLLFGLRRYELKRILLKNNLEKKHFEAEKLMELDGVKSQFFANISHEFRTPLTLILGPLDKLMKEELPAAVKQQLKIMRRNSFRLKLLINQILDLSKIEAGKMKLAARSEDVTKVIRLMVQSFSSLAESKNITIEYQTSHEFINAYVDLEKFEKIILNLISNAIKFTHDGGKVIVSVINENENVEIKVADTGVGIPAEQIPYVFDRFHQVDMSSTRKEEGTGIGLALVKEFVDLHHGEIRVESNPGKGSTFSVILKAGKEHLSAEEITEQKSRTDFSESQIQEALVNIENSDFSVNNEQGDIATEKPLVLITEDNEDMRLYIGECLYPENSVLYAENGEVGLKLSFEKVPDLIISDVMMPEMDGFEFCEKIKTDQRTNHIPLILLTARATGESKLEGLETGADDYLTKPFEVWELQVRVKNLIEQRQRLRERFHKEIILGSEQVVMTSANDKFLQKITAIVELQMTNPDFSVEEFAREASLSRVQLHRKLQSLTGMSATKFIRTLRIKRAAELLKQHTGNVSEIAFEVGFNSLPYFHKCFREQYHTTPTDYQA